MSSCYSPFDVLFRKGYLWTHLRMCLRAMSVAHLKTSRRYDAVDGCVKHIRPLELDCPDVYHLLSDPNGHQSVYPITYSPHCCTRYFFQFHSHNNVPPTNQYPFSSPKVTRSTIQITLKPNVLLRSSFIPHPTYLLSF